MFEKVIEKKGPGRVISFWEQPSNLVDNFQKYIIKMEVKQHWHPNSSQYCEKKSPHHQLYSNIVVVSLANDISKMRLLQNKVTNYGNNQFLPITSMTSLLSTGTDIRATVYW